MYKTLDNERGAVLIAALLILVILTLIGITAMESSDMEGRMTSNLQSRNIALQAAEMALREAEAFLEQSALPLFSGTNATPNANGLYQPTIDVEALSWNASDSVAISGDLPSGAVAKPRYIIENLGEFATTPAAASLLTGTEINEKNTYRITAYGVGQRPSAVVILQSTYTP